jgi:hypothetical protein
MEELDELFLGLLCNNTPSCLFDLHNYWQLVYSTGGILELLNRMQIYSSRSLLDQKQQPLPVYYCLESRSC